MNAVSTPEAKAAALAHYTAQAAIASFQKRDRVALVCLAGKFECEASFDVQGGAVFIDKICFDASNWVDPAEFLLPSAIALIEADIAETLRECGQ